MVYHDQHLLWQQPSAHDIPYHMYGFQHAPSAGGLEYRKPGMLGSVWQGMKRFFGGGGMRKEAMHELPHQHQAHYEGLEQEYMKNPHMFMEHEGLMQKPLAHEIAHEMAQGHLRKGDGGLVWELPKQKWWWQKQEFVPKKMVLEEEPKGIIQRTKETAKQMIGATNPTTSGKGLGETTTKLGQAAIQKGRGWFSRMRSRLFIRGSSLAKVMHGVKLGAVSHLVYSAIDNSHYLAAGETRRYFMTVGQDTLRGAAIGGALASIAVVFPTLGTLASIAVLVTPAITAYMTEGCDKRFIRYVAMVSTGIAAASFTLMLTGMPMLAGAAAGFWSYMARTTF